LRIPKRMCQQISGSGKIHIFLVPFSAPYPSYICAEKINSNQNLPKGQSAPQCAVNSHCTALHCTALHSTILHCTSQHYTVLHCTSQHYTVLHCTALHCTSLHCTALHCTSQHYTVLHITALYYTALLCISLDSLRCVTL
jgi:hypothetical protein